MTKAITKAPSEDIAVLTDEYRKIREGVRDALATYDTAISGDGEARQGLAGLWMAANKYLDMEETHKIQYLEVWTLFQKKLDDLLAFEMKFKKRLAELKKIIEGKTGEELDEAIKVYAAEHRQLLLERESNEKMFKDFANVSSGMWDSYQRMKREQAFFYHVSQVQKWYGAMLAVLQNNIHDQGLLTKIMKDTVTAWKAIDGRAGNSIEVEVKE